MSAGKETTMLCVHCDETANFTCGGCHESNYCSPECQTEHWEEEHSEECALLIGAEACKGDVLKVIKEAKKEIGKRMDAFKKRVNAYSKMSDAMYKQANKDAVEKQGGQLLKFINETAGRIRKCCEADPNCYPSDMDDIIKLKQKVFQIAEAEGLTVSTYNV